MSKLLELAREYMALDLPRDPELRKLAIRKHMEETNGSNSRQQNCPMERFAISGTNAGVKAR